jgi:tetratricopeptide (TPR) repeat protein
MSVARLVRSHPPYQKSRYCDVHSSDGGPTGAKLGTGLSLFPCCQSYPRFGAQRVELSSSLDRLISAGDDLLNRHDWFRNTSWDPEIEAAFFKKLARAKDKSQYLRIQASTLASSCPHVALRLLDQYFTLGEHFDVAQAHVDRASAYLRLGQVDSAILAYEAALAREASHPHLQTQAYLELPFLVATQRLSQHYDRAITLLESHRSRLMFPVDRFRWSCAVALIRSDQGDHGGAQEAARNALAASSDGTSGFRYHPKVGLVASVDEALHKRLSELAI